MIWCWSVNYGVPFDRLRGMEEYLDTLNVKNPEILYIGVSDNKGKELYKSDEASAAATTKIKTTSKAPQILPSSKAEMIVTTFDISKDGQKLGTIKLGMDGKYFEKMVDKILLDIVTVGLVSLLVAFELLSPSLSVVTSPPQCGRCTPISTASKIKTFPFLLSAAPRTKQGMPLLPPTIWSTKST